MPLLAILLTKDLWDGKWAPYGALLSLELYSTKENDMTFLFRFIYNGKPLILKSCATALCDVTVLLDALSFGQKQIPEACDPIPTPQVKVKKENVYSESNNTLFSLLFSLPILLTVFLSCSCSALCTYYCFVCKKDSSMATNSKYSRIDAMEL
jgi:hypothetical protein